MQGSYLYWSGTSVVKAYDVIKKFISELPGVVKLSPDILVATTQYYKKLCDWKVPILDEQAISHQ